MGEVLRAPKDFVSDIAPQWALRAKSFRNRELPTTTANCVVIVATALPGYQVRTPCLVAVPRLSYLLPKVVFGDGSSLVTIEDMDHANFLKADGGKLANRNINDLPPQSCGNGFENRSRRMRGHIDNKFLQSVIQRSQ